jgi:hypothetical protein
LRRGSKILLQYSRRRHNGQFRDASPRRRTDAHTILPSLLRTVAKMSGLTAG